jgi:hypothetical protein
MGEENLNNFLLINMKGTPVKETDPAKAVDHCHFSAETVRHVHGYMVYS